MYPEMTDQKDPDAVMLTDQEEVIGNKLLTV